jgi:hypothetical protein
LDEDQPAADRHPIKKIYDPEGVDVMWLSVYSMVSCALVGAYLETWEGGFELKKRLSMIAGGVLLAGLASSQTSGSVQIDDNGAVISAHQHRHAKNGETLVWSRTSAGKSWQVQFLTSPCANGVKTFGSANGLPKRCVIVVHCASPGSSACVYAYNSSTGPGQPQQDPDVIVDN